MSASWVNQLRQLPPFKVYSQCGEEAYILHILQNLGLRGRWATKVIVDLGAGDGQYLSNTAYLRKHIGYRTHMFDADNKGNTNVKQAFITRDNVCELLADAHCPKEFDFLSIDLDGNDYHILSSLLDGGFKPTLIVAEFNPIWNKHIAMVIEYNEKHTWQNDDYYGFSFAAGELLAAKYGYTVVHQNDDLNMYMVRNEALEEMVGPDYKDLILPVTYNVQQYHPKSNRTDWVMVGLQ